MKKLLVLVCLVPVLLGAKPVGIVVAGSDDGMVVVDLSGYRGNLNPYSVWVAVYCYDEDRIPASAQFLPVQYGDNRDPHPTLGEAGPFALTTDDCEAWAFVYPSTKPISNTATL